MKLIIDWIVKLYLLPISISTKLALYVKGLILRYDEHFAIAIDVIKRDFPNSDGVVVDIGAYDGDSAIYFSKRLPKLKILGFEPNPNVFARGKELTKRFPNIQLFNFGFSDVMATIPLFVTKNQDASSLFELNDSTEASFERKIDVQVTTLDQHFHDAPEILLMKLDVQGAELKILERGIQTLTKTKLVLTEVQVADMYAGGCFYFEIDSFLRKNNFTLHTIISKYNNQGTKYFDMLYMQSNLLTTRG